MASHSAGSSTGPTSVSESLSPAGSSEGSAVAESVNSVRPPSRRRTAEKNRRRTTNTFFDQLVTLLSITSGDGDIQKKQDKASILCSARNFVRFYHDLSTFHGSPLAALPAPTPPGTFRQPPSASPHPPASVDTTKHKVDPKKLRCHNSGMLMEHVLQACNGFLLVMVPPGRIMYSSKTTLSSLGVSPSALAGQLLSTILCQEDVHQVLEPPSPRQLPAELHNGQRIIAHPRTRARYEFQRSYGLTTTGSMPLSSTCSSYLRQWTDSTSTSNDSGAVSYTDSNLSYDYCHILVAINGSLSFLDSELAMDEDFKFEMRISKEGRIIEVQKHAAIAIGYTTMELIGTSVFDFIHPYHVVSFGEAIQSCTTRGCGTTNLYRFFTKGGQWLWCAARGFIACNPWNHDTDHIVLEMKIMGTNQVDSQLRNSIDLMCMPRSDEPEWCGLCIANEQPVIQEPPPPRIQGSTASVDGMQKRLKELEKELQIKNSALFDSQIQLLEQQNLLNQERKKFLDLTETLVKEFHPGAQPTTTTAYAYCKDPNLVEASRSPSLTHHYTQVMQQASPLHVQQTTAASLLQQTSQHLQQSTPHLQQTSPHLQQTSPRFQPTTAATFLQQTSPHPQQTSPHLQQTSPHLQQTSQHLQQTSPHLQQTPPSLQQTSPHLQQLTAATLLQQTSPHLQQNSPHLQQTTAPTLLQQTSPHLQQTTTATLLQQTTPSQSSSPPYCFPTQPEVTLPDKKMSSMDTMDVGLDFIAEFCGDHLFQTLPTNLHDPNTRP